jgi:hypothetical protein
LRDDLGGNLAARHQRLPDRDCRALADHQDLIELDRVADRGLELLDPNALSGARAVLLTAGAKNGIHD